MHCALALCRTAWVCLSFFSVLGGWSREKTSVCICIRSSLVLFHFVGGWVVPRTKIWPEFVSSQNWCYLILGEWEGFPKKKIEFVSNHISFWMVLRKTFGLNLYQAKFKFGFISFWVGFPKKKIQSEFVSNQISFSHLDGWSWGKNFGLNLYQAKSGVISFWVGRCVVLRKKNSLNSYQAKSGVIWFLGSRLWEKIGLILYQVKSSVISFSGVVQPFCEKKNNNIIVKKTTPGWPRHRENREFGSYFSRQGKHREFCCNTGKVLETQEKYFWLYLLTLTLPSATIVILANFPLCAEKYRTHYRLGPVNLNTVNSKFHLIQTFLIISATFLSFQL